MSGKTIREAIGFVGVVGSLVFVGLEIRQNTIAARAAAYQAIGEGMAETWQGGSQSPELATTMLRYFEDENAEFTPAEEAWLITTNVAALRRYEAVWRQVNLGLLDPSALNYFGFSPIDGSNESRERLWLRTRAFFDPDFLTFLESRGAIN